MAHLDIAQHGRIPLCFVKGAHGKFGIIKAIKLKKLLFFAIMKAKIGGKGLRTILMLHPGRDTKPRLVSTGCHMEPPACHVYFSGGESQKFKKFAREKVTALQENFAKSNGDAGKICQDMFCAICGGHCALAALA